MTYETDEVDATLRNQARLQHAMLAVTVKQICADTDMDERIALTNWLNEGRRLLFGEEAESTDRPKGKVISLGTRLRPRPSGDAA